MCKGCSHGTLLHIKPPGCRSSICYYHQDLHRRRLQVGSRPVPSAHTAAPLLLTGACRPWSFAPVLPQWSGIGVMLKRHPFSELVASAGELLHTPWRLPTSMATVLLSLATNAFPGF